MKQGIVASAEKEEAASHAKAGDIRTIESNGSGSI
jgi:hypothetical protein